MRVQEAIKYRYLTMKQIQEVTGLLPYQIMQVISQLPVRCMIVAGQFAYKIGS